MEKLYTIGEVAEEFGVTRVTVYDWMRRYGLPYVQLGGRRRVRESDLLKFIRPVLPTGQDWRDRHLDAAAKV